MARKKASVFFALMLSCIVLSAVSLDDIANSAMENNPSYRNMVLSYENGVLSLRELDLEDQMVWTVSGEVNPLAKNVAGVPIALKDGEYGISIAPSATLTLPNGNTKINVSSIYAMDYKNNYNVISPSISVNHNFDFSGFDKNYGEDLSYSKQDLSLNLSYSESLISFRKSIISTVSQLLTLENTIESSARSLSKSEKSLSDIEALGTLSKDSASYKNQVNLIASAKNSLDNLKRQLENAKVSFKNLTGLDWTGVDDLEKPLLEIQILEGGNTEVYLKALDIDIAQNNYDATYASLNPSMLAASGTVSGGYTNSNATGGKSAGTLNISGGATYSSSSWSVGARPSISFEFPSSGDTKTTPSLTISGSWTKGKSDESQSITLSKLQNNIVTAENNYYNALTSYIQEGQSLILKIMQWENKCSEKLENISYLETVYDTQSQLFELGLATQTAKDDALFNLDNARKEWKILMLEGESLKCDLSSYAL